VPVKESSFIDSMTIVFLSKIIQILLAVIITVLVLIQSKNSGLAQGLKGSFGAYRSMRGFEKIVFGATVACGVLLVLNSILLIYLKR
jgi:protein translocase SecG subunit